VADRILLIEDDRRLAEMVQNYLGGAGFDVAVAPKGGAGLALHSREAFDAIVLDLMLPDMDGLEVCRRIRTQADIPILMLTAKADEVDRVVGLELGADDYVTKPFSPRELTLRVRAILRRRQPAETATTPVLERAALRLDPERHRCFVDEEEVELTAKEFSLLRELMSRPGRVMTREQLLDDVWGTDIAVTTRTIDTHLKRLREKLGAASHLIETVRGVGYRFAE
jgi:two-component system phosphate regulon response regulator PhoB